MFTKILFSEQGTSDRVKEEATYMMFLDLLYEAEGMPDTIYACPLV